MSTSIELGKEETIYQAFVYTRAGIFYVICRSSVEVEWETRADNSAIVPKASIHGIRSLRQLLASWASCLRNGSFTGSIVSFVFARGKPDILGSVECGATRWRILDVGRGSCLKTWLTAGFASALRWLNATAILRLMTTLIFALSCRKRYVANSKILRSSIQPDAASNNHSTESLASTGARLNPPKSFLSTKQFTLGIWSSRKARESALCTLNGIPN